MWLSKILLLRKNTRNKKVSFSAYQLFLPSFLNEHVRFYTFSEPHWRFCMLPDAIHSLFLTVLIDFLSADCTLSIAGWGYVLYHHCYDWLIFTTLLFDSLPDFSSLSLIWKVVLALNVIFWCYSCDLISTYL